jgi:hypothetical protein
VLREEEQARAEAGAEAGAGPRVGAEAAKGGALS